MNYKKLAHDILKQWMQENNLEGKYVIHHRDDNEEVKAYNKAHYKRWGFDLDGTFTLGKWVVFLTHGEHSRYHNTGKIVSEETKQKMRDNHADFRGENNPMYGKTFTDEHRKKLSDNHADFRGERNPMYGKCPMYGKHHSHETKRKMSETNCKLSVLYHAYKDNGGTLSWNEFQRALKNGEQTVLNLIPDDIYIGV